MASSLESVQIKICSRINRHDKDRNSRAAKKFPWRRNENGCALGGVAPLNSAQTNKSVTATFGTVSSTSATSNEIYVRVKLTTGQSLTAISIEAPTN